MQATGMHHAAARATHSLNAARCLIDPPPLPSKARHAEDLKPMWTAPPVPATPSGTLPAGGDDVDARRRHCLHQGLRLLAGTAALGGCADGGISSPPEAQNYRQKLYSPTQICRIGSHYFIVDCWHHRILYSKRPDHPLGNWRILDDDLAGPHSIASDGQLYVTEDTGRHALKVYRQAAADSFVPVQTLPDIGRRPHRSRYDASHDLFIVLGSLDQSLHLLGCQHNRLQRLQQLWLAELQGQYCRSFTLHQGLIYVLGSREILLCRIEQRQLRSTGQRIALPAACHGSNDLYFLDNERSILTATPGKAFLFEHPDALARGEFTDISAAFRGTPYYLEVFDNQLWIPEINAYSAISRLPLETARQLRGIDGLAALKRLFDVGPPGAASIERREQLPR